MGKRFSFGAESGRNNNLVDSHENDVNGIASRRGAHFFQIAIRVAFLTVLAIFLFAQGCGAENPPILKWSTDGLYSLLPPPTTEYGSVTAETSDSLEFTMNGVEKADFSLYVQLCSEKGFNTSIVNSDFFYSAVNSRGYKVSIQYTKSKNEMTVSLDASAVLINVGRPSDDFRGLMYTDVIDMMKALGFINVQTKEVSVSADSDYADYSVESVTVDGRRFAADDSLRCSLPVVVSYYRRSIEIAFSADELNGKDKGAVENILRNAGFTNITLCEMIATPDSALPDFMDGKTISVSINGQTAFEKGKQFPPAAFITVTYHNLDVIMETSSEGLKGQPKDKVVNSLRNMGFKNIQIVATAEGGERLSYLHDDTVGGISIGGVDGFSSGKRFKRFETVIVSYYEFDITVGRSSKDIKSGMKYQAAEDYLRSLGFVNIKTQASHELITGIINKPDEIKSISVNGETKFEWNDVFHHDDEIIIIYYAY